jgi:serine protease AprX
MLRLARNLVLAIPANWQKAMQCAFVDYFTKKSFFKHYKLINCIPMAHNKLILKLGIILFLISVLQPSHQALSQTSHYWVFFTDKDGVEFDPMSYFDAKAIERRVINNVDLYHITDFPVRDDYISSVDEIATETVFASRWFNALAVEATPEQIGQIRQLHFVRETEAIYSFAVLCGQNQINLSDNQTELAGLQLDLMQGHLFRKHDLTGKGIRIAVFDGGFPEVDTHPAFDRLRRENRIIKTWDFTRNRENVYTAISHGLSVLSNIGGQYYGMQLGLATDAEFLLARTEIRSEPKVEEVWWLQAAEWADRNGAHIINSSLGYGYHRYFPENMDGKHSIVSRAANMAASKGIVVVNAMGNEGEKQSWKVLITPADADSVLSVGGIEPFSRLPISFTSLGPTADGRRKPNVSNSAYVVVATQKSVGTSYGTSFATPLTSGFMACAMQSRPGTPAMEMIRLVEESGNLYPWYDYAHGYGVPQASYFTEERVADSLESFSILEINRELVVELSECHFPANTTANESLMPGRYLYYHIQLADGMLKKYGVIEVKERRPYIIRTIEIPYGASLRVAFNGTVKEWSNF